MDKIAAGIVLYNPEIDRLKENIGSILPQVDFIILVDNGSTNIKEVELIYNNYNNIFLIKNEDNMGIAKALNQIVKFCEEKDYNWVLTLDQDSVCQSNLISCYKKYIEFSDIGIITPTITDRNIILEYKNSKIDSKYDYVDKCITSASLINLNLCKSIGYFDEIMFIDLVDFEYCIRVQKAGYKILRVNEVELIHQLGNLRIYNFFGKKINITNHSVLRNYYHARNAIYYLRKHRDYLSFKKIYLRLIITIFKVLIFEKYKFSKLKAIISGTIVGLKMELKI